jgi:hypothetical protein
MICKQHALSGPHDHRSFFWIAVAMALIHVFSCAPLFAAQATVIPWSGYWWPYRQGGLATGAGYRGRPAPLEKYLMLTEGITSGPLISWYLSYYYDPEAPHWHGLCPYFARAAVLDSYEILPSSEDNIVFRVGDKKGILTLCHDFVVADISASGRDPVNLHYWLLEYIGRQKKAFIADLDADEEVWYYPVYAYNMTTSRTSMTESVTVTIFCADDSVPPDFMGTREKRKTYTYTLSLNAGGDIVGGQWTGNSVFEHPSYLEMPVSTMAKCPHLDCAEVRRIAQAADDFLEMPGDDPVPLSPGAYRLVLLNKDRFRVDGDPGDEFLVIIKKEDGSLQNMNVVISDHSDRELTSQMLPAQASMVYRIIMNDPPYFISLSQNNYRTDPNIYTLTLDLRTPWRLPVPYIPKGGQWSGFALSNAGDETAEDVLLVTGTSDGRPLHTVFGPADLAPGEKQMFFFDDLPWRKHEYSASSSIMLISRHPVEMVNLFAFDEQSMAGFGRPNPAADRLVIPDIYYETMSADRFMQGAVKNESFFTADLRMRLYSPSGVLRNEIIQQLPAGGQLPVRPGISPFYPAPDNGWMMVESTNARLLSGYQYTENRAGSRSTMETLFALPVTSGRKIVPHVPPPTGRWTTWLTVINANDGNNLLTVHPALAGADDRWDMEIELSPFEKRKIDLSGFGKTEGDPLYRSILEISGTSPIAGYYMYSPPDGGDEAAHPLIDNGAIKNELVLAHNADEGGRWWTGVGLFNPNAYRVEIWLTPHDGTGGMAADPQTLSLEPGAYEVFTLRSRFGVALSDIAFMTFSAKDPVSAPIGGFYLYGNTGNKKIGNMKSLSGANM